MSAYVSRSTPLVTQLNNEWDEIGARRFNYGAALGLHVARELFAKARATKGVDQDRILYSLIAAGREGNVPAERLLLQVLVPAASRMAHRVRGYDEFSRQDRVGIAISKSWEVIRTYPLHLDRRVHANLTMRLLGELTPPSTANERLIASKTIAVSDQDLEAYCEPVELHTLMPRRSPEAQLHELFAWAVDQRFVAPEEVALVSRAYLGEESWADIAADLGVAVEGARTKVRRIRERLQRAAQIALVEAA